MANDSIRGRQVVLRLTNKSGGGLVEGDVVIISSGTAAAVTTTTSAGLTTDIIGVALETIANDAIGRICISGYVPKINLSAAASLGDTFATHSVAKQAAPSGSRGAGHFGEVLGTGATPAALLWGFPDVSAAAGMAGDALWDAAGDLAVGTGANTGARLAIGTAGQGLRVNAGATALEYVSGGRVLILEQTPTGTGTVTWSSIPATYKSLVIEGVARGTQVATLTAMSCYLNNDSTAANYRYTYHQIEATTGHQTGVGDGAIVAQISAASATAGQCGAFSIWIPQYAGTTFNKVIRCDSQARISATVQYNNHFIVERENTEAVNRVDLVLAANNYDTGSTMRLYGMY